MIDTTQNNDPWVYVKDKVVPDELCDEIIKKFDESQTQQFQGKIGDGDVKPFVKTSTDINIAQWMDWRYLSNPLLDILSTQMNLYMEFCSRHTRESFTTGALIPLMPNYREIEADGFQLQKTPPGKGYTWHSDCFPGRLITYIFYLNSVEEGHTEFYSGAKIQPQKGRICIFPADWTYFHQGLPPKQDKYIAIGWMRETIFKRAL